MILEPTGAFLPGDARPRCRFCYGIEEAHHPECEWRLVDQYRMLLPDELASLKTALQEEWQQAQEVQESCEGRMALIDHVEAERAGLTQAELEVSLSQER